MANANTKLLPSQTMGKLWANYGQTMRGLCAVYARMNRGMKKAAQRAAFSFK